MGRDGNAACMDCGKRYYFGHGSSTTWMDQHETVEAFDAELAEHGVTKVEGRNADVRAFLVEHEGHRTVRWSTDYCYIDDKGDLRLDYDDDLIEPGIGGLALYEGTGGGGFVQLCAVCGHDQNAHDYGDGSRDLSPCTAADCKCEDWQEVLDAWGRANQARLKR